jgi:hypothetical protein
MSPLSLDQTDSFFYQRQRHVHSSNPYGRGRRESELSINIDLHKKIWLFTTLVHMDFKCEYTSILGKKIRWFGRAITGLFHFLLDQATFAVSCIMFFAICEKVKFCY